jgi:hypothetical protein
VNFFLFGVIIRKAKEPIMPGREYETLISSTATAGSATYYLNDKKSVSLGLSATGGSSPVAAYEVKLYLTPDTPDAAAISYKAASSAAVAVFENVADSNGTPFNFYKMVVSYSSLAASSGTPSFTAAVSSY